MRKAWIWIAVLALAGCARPPEQVRPAVWQVEDERGAQAWLLGTVHALPRPVDWRSPVVEQALADADRVAVEIADLDHAVQDGGFEALARSSSLAAVDARIGSDLAPAARRLTDRAGKSVAALQRYETWAVALLLAGAAQPDADPGNGIDRQVIALAHERDLPVVELEGARRQFGIFDALREREQRTMLRAIVSEADTAEADAARLARAWAHGNEAVLAKATREGMLADAGLREALYLARNRDWAHRIEAMMRRSERPFVAVGAAHLAGDQGVPAMLAARGYKVRRIQ